MGRTATEDRFGEKEKAQIEALSAYLTIEQIADYFGINRRTFHLMRNRSPEIDALYKAGKARANAKMAQSLIKTGMDGNVSAQIFYLKTQARWRETAPEQTDLPPLTIHVVDATPEQDIPEQE